MAVKIMTDPSPLNSPPKNKIKVPIVATILEIVMILLIGMSSSSVFINCDTNTELKKIATTKEELKTTDNVTGK